MAQLQGEYKLWILRPFLIPSYNFSMAVNAIPKSSIKKMEGLSLRFIKKWLCIPRSFSTATLYHPQVMGIPSLMELKTKAKLTLLCSIFTSCDPMIQELSNIFMDHE